MLYVCELDNPQSQLQCVFSDFLTNSNTELKEVSTGTHVMC